MYKEEKIKTRVDQVLDEEISRLEKSRRLHMSNIEVNQRRLEVIDLEIDTYKKMKSLLEKDIKDNSKEN